MLISQKSTDQLSASFKEGSLNTFLNPYSYLLARNSLSIFSCFDNIFIDGGMLILILRILRIKKIKRISFDFTSIADDVMQYCIDQNKSIYFVGSKDNEISVFQKKIKDKYPNLNILGYRNGYFNVQEKHQFSQKINSIQPDIIVVGMGTPYQEELLVYLKVNGWGGIGFTCGGFIHQTASANDGVDYYPALIDKFNMRWLYRMYDEPKLLKRYLFLYPQALLVIIKDRLQC